MESLMFQKQFHSDNLIMGKVMLLIIEVFIIFSEIITTIKQSTTFSIKD